MPVERPALGQLAGPRKAATIGRVEVPTPLPQRFPWAPSKWLGNDDLDPGVGSW